MDFSLKEKDIIIKKINYFLHNRKEAVVWPLYTKEDADELIAMDPSLKILFKDLTFGKTSCQIRYNGTIFAVDEIGASSSIKKYLEFFIDGEWFDLDPECVEFIGA